MTPSVVAGGGADGTLCCCWEGAEGTLCSCWEGADGTLWIGGEGVVCTLWSSCGMTEVVAVVFAVAVSVAGVVAGWVRPKEATKSERVSRNDCTVGASEAGTVKALIARVRSATAAIS